MTLIFLDISTCATCFPPSNGHGNSHLSVDRPAGSLGRPLGPLGALGADACDGQIGQINGAVSMAAGCGSSNTTRNDVFNGTYPLKIVF